jgi:hypothetical protein
MSGRNPTPVMKRTSKWMKREEENPRLPGFVYTPPGPTSRFSDAEKKKVRRR